jgi:hypothetical protein
VRAVDLSGVTWRKSSYSNTSGGDCLEVAPGLPSLVPVRDSKAPSHGALLFGVSAWGAFVDRVKQGPLAG